MSSEYFTNIPSKYLNMPSQKYKWPDSLESDPVLKIIDKYTDHLCINLIQTKNNPRVFNFTQKNRKR